MRFRFQQGPRPPFLYGCAAVSSGSLAPLLTGIVTPGSTIAIPFTIARCLSRQVTNLIAYVLSIFGSSQFRVFVLLYLMRATSTYREQMACLGRKLSTVPLKFLVATSNSRMGTFLIETNS